MPFEVFIPLTTTTQLHTVTFSSIEKCFPTFLNKDKMKLIKWKQRHISIVHKYNQYDFFFNNLGQ